MIELSYDVPLLHFSISNFEILIPKSIYTDT